MIRITVLGVYIGVALFGETTITTRRTDKKLVSASVDRHPCVKLHAMFRASKKGNQTMPSSV